MPEDQRTDELQRDEIEVLSERSRWLAKSMLDAAESLEYLHDH